MLALLNEVCYASLPFAALPALAGVRCAADVSVTVIGDRAWVRWPPGEERVLGRLLPVAGVELYTCRDGLWYRLGQHLPAFNLPTDAESRPLDRVLVPAPVEPAEDPIPALTPAVLPLVREDRPRAATALLSELGGLAAWADTATTAQVAALRGPARCGSQVLVLGEKLPLLGGERFWGQRLLAPLGLVPEPALPEAVLLAALDAGDGELVLLREDGIERIADEVFRPLTRAAVRLALREHA